jgi:hypothetical protein
MTASIASKFPPNIQFLSKSLILHPLQHSGIFGRLIRAIYQSYDQKLHQSRNSKSFSARKASLSLTSSALRLASAVQGSLDVGQ